MGIFCVCCLHPAIVAEPSWPSVQLSAMLCLLLAAFGTCIVSRPVWGHIVLELSQTRPFAKDVVTPNFRVLSLCCPEKLSLVGGACGQTRYLLPTHCWDNSQNSVCGYLSLLRTGVTLEGCWPLMRLLAHCQACLAALHGLLVWLEGVGP